MRMIWRILVLLMSGGLVPGVATAAPDLPAGLVKRIARDPAAWEEEGLRLIVGFGGENGLTAAGIDRAVAVDQAAARANALRDLLVADLDGDGVVTAAELGAYLPVLSARGRGGFALSVAQADRNSDGDLDAAELAAAGHAAAATAVSPRRLETMRSLLAFDSDGDGAVTVPELHRGVAVLAATPAETGDAGGG